MNAYKNRNIQYTILCLKLQRLCPRILWFQRKKLPEFVHFFVRFPIFPLDRAENVAYNI